MYVNILHILDQYLLGFVVTIRYFLLEVPSSTIPTIM